jgi:hypothetical protein
MAINNFKFPGVELHQEFVETPVTGVSQLGVVVVGEKFKTATESWVYGGTASTLFFKGVDASDGEAIVSDGFFKGFEATSAGNLKINSSTISSTTASVVFNANVTSGTASEAAFGSLVPAIGDAVDVTGSSDAVRGVITAINGMTVGVTTETAVTGSSVTKLAFYKIADGKLNGVSLVAGSDADGNSGTVASLPASATAVLIGGSTNNATLQEGTYDLSVKVASTDKFELCSVGSYTEIKEAFGDVSKQNEMATALNLALDAANGNVVYYLGVKEATAAGYTEALDFLDKYNNVYSIVPITADTDIIKACVTYAETTSSNVESKVRRTVWYGIDADSNGDILATRFAVGTSYRAQAVWADGALFRGYSVPNHVLAAAPAGMRSGEAVYRPISNLGYTDFSLSEVNGKTKSQLEELGANGVWLIANNYDGTPVNMKQVTTAVSNNINKDEESIVANADSIALTLCRVGENLVGCSNISPDLLVALHDTLTGIMERYLLNLTGNVYIGPQLLSYSIDRLEQDPVQLDHIYATITCEPPKPFNRFVLTLRIV